MLLDIQREHLEEAEFLWARRRSERYSPLLDLRGLAELEERLDAHLDGLGAGVEEVWAGLEEALAGGEHDARAAAAAAMAMAGSGASLVARLARLEPAAIAAVTEALCYVDLAPATASALRELLAGADAGAAAAPAAGDHPASASHALAAAIDVLSFHRALGAADLKAFLRPTSPTVLVALLRALGRVGGDAGSVETASRHVSAPVREAALAAMVRRGFSGAHQACRNAVADKALVTGTACALLGAIGEPGDARLLVQACKYEAAGEAPVAGLASLGAVACVDALLDLMSDVRLACAAGAAFTRITGLVAPTLPEGAPGPEVEDATFDELRPRPDPTGARSLWAEHAGTFDEKSRCRSGKRLDAKAWRRDANQGDLLTRREELLRLWSSEPTLHTALELDAPARRQLKISTGGER